MVDLNLLQHLRVVHEHMLVVQCHLLVRLLLLILRSVVVAVTTLLRLLQLLLLLLLLLHALILKHLLLLRLETVPSSVEVSRVLEVLTVSQLTVLVAVNLLLSVEELEVVEDALSRRSFLVDLQHFLACRFILQLSAVLAARNIIALAKRYQRIISCLFALHTLFVRSPHSYQFLSPSKAFCFTFLTATHSILKWPLNYTQRRMVS